MGQCVGARNHKVNSLPLSFRLTDISIPVLCEFCVLGSFILPVDIHDASCPGSERSFEPKWEHRRAEDRRYWAVSARVSHIAFLTLTYAPCSGGIFSLFTVALFVSHVHLISLNQTTVESLGFRSMQEREEATLGNMYAWYQFGWVPPSLLPLTLIL